MNEQRFAFRLAVASSLLLVTACQTAGPVYQTFYSPVTETANASALLEAAEAACNEQANVEARRASDSAYARAEVNVPSTNESRGNAGALVRTPAQMQARVAREAAMTQARAVYRDTWASVKQACMAERGFQEVSACVSGCTQ